MDMLTGITGTPNAVQKEQKWDHAELYTFIVDFAKPWRMKELAEFR